MARIFTMVTLRLTRWGGNRLGYLTDELCGTLVEGKEGTAGMGGLGIKIEHKNHPGDISAITDGKHHILRSQGFRW